MHRGFLSAPGSYLLSVQALLSASSSSPSPASKDRQQLCFANHTGVGLGDVFETSPTCNPPQPVTFTSPIHSFRRAFLAFLHCSQYTHRHTRMHTWMHSHAHTNALTCSPPKFSCCINFSFVNWSPSNVLYRMLIYLFCACIEIQLKCKFYSIRDSCV